ncbi:MAG TPA: MarR family winged helix-turn-helix transcriptional regulator [Thermoplasmata archaeon]|nr:MarR family winged helix-turn-helix transcriptional regulator [Thermoplasmata archaeon]
MTTPSPNRDAYRDVPLSALLYVTRGTYTAAVRRAQDRIGCGGVPAAGEVILNAMEWSGASLESVIRFLGITKQAVSQTVETLVARGYLERAPDPADRRRVKLTLTERGHAAGRAGRAAIEQVDRELLARVGPQQLRHARATLVALLEIKRKNQRADGPEGA